MGSIEREIEGAAGRWLGLWRAWGKPLVSLPVRFLTNADGSPSGKLHESAIELQLVGEGCEIEGVWMQSCRVQVEGLNLSELVGQLAGVSVFDDCIVVLCEEPRWHGIMTVAMAVLAAHLKAASVLMDVDAMRALDPMFAGEQVALLEACMLSAAQDVSAETKENPSTPIRGRRI